MEAIQTAAEAFSDEVRSRFPAENATKQQQRAASHTEESEDALAARIDFRGVGFIVLEVALHARDARITAEA